ncbi:5' exonuclease Apollo [Bulinus truncatus]|nr:5' exonuclease Apollo [Bulinus truncatus]
MNGRIIPKTCIAVDFWKIKGCAKYFHFLTHTHGDHVVGLTSTWQRPIYCSEITALLLKERFGVPQRHLNILPLNQSVIIHVSFSESFTVTCYDANHCPGSVMFYFEGRFGNIFYTGDFRVSSEIVNICRELSKKVDLLYLDNTYCSPKYSFPSREKCFQEILDIIGRHPNHNVIIGVRKLGKEQLLGQLGENLNETITVSDEMYRLYNEMFSTNVFTAVGLCQESTRISTTTVDTIQIRLKEFKMISPTIGIIPSALFPGLKGSQDDSDLFLVPYSDHSNYEELIQFVSTLRPAKIVPIVSPKKSSILTDISDTADMSCFNKFLFSPTRNPLNQPVNIMMPSINSFQPVTFSEHIHAHTKPFRKREITIAPIGMKKKAKGVIYEDLPDVQNSEHHKKQSKCKNSTYIQHIPDERSFTDRLKNVDGTKSECVDLTELPDDITIPDRLKNVEGNNPELVDLTELPDDITIQ